MHLILLLTQSEMIDFDYKHENAKSCNMHIISELIIEHKALHIILNSNLVEAQKAFREQMIYLAFKLSNRYDVTVDEKVIINIIIWLYYLMKTQNHIHVVELLIV